MSENATGNSKRVPERRSFNLALEFLENAERDLELRRSAFGTALGSVISSSVLVILALLMGASVHFALGLVLVHQSLRTAVLWWHSHKALTQYAEIEKQTTNTAEHLAKQYPVENDAAA